MADAATWFDAICMKPFPPDALLDDLLKDPVAPGGSGDGGPLAELKGHAVTLREQAIALLSACACPSTHERLVCLVSEIVDEIERLKRPGSDAVPSEVRAAVAALATRVADFELLLRNRAPGGESGPAILRPDPPQAARPMRAGRSG